MARVTPRQAGALAVAWLFLALFFGALYRFADGSERHAYNVQSTPPGAVHLTQGHHYQLSTKSGQSGMVAAGQQISTANCIWRTADSADEPLGVTGLAADSGAIHVVGTFVAPATGSIEITCSGLGPVFIDDADNSGTDLALLFLLASAGLAAIGVTLGLWALYQGSLAQDRPSSPAPGWLTEGVREGVRNGVPDGGPAADDAPVDNSMRPRAE